MASILQRLGSSSRIATQAPINSFFEKVTHNPAIITTTTASESRNFHCSPALSWLIKESRLNVVDDSEIGRQAKAVNKPPRIIGIWGDHTRRGPRFKYAQLGDKVTVAVRGQVKWGYIVGCKLVQQPMIPKFDSNNVVLVEKNGTPMGKRVLVPVPSALRKKADGEFSKVLAICSKFY